MTNAIQHTLFGYSVQPGEAPVECIHLPATLAFPAGEIDERKCWLAQHADTDVILLGREGMRMHVRAIDGTTGLVLITELDPATDGGTG